MRGPTPGPKDDAVRAGASADSEGGWSMALPDLRATEQLAATLAAELKPGDLVTLSGDLGAGKTAFARALIRAIANDPELEVPSPTYTLMQTYPTARMTIVHADLYRIDDPRELEELGWEESAENALVIVEWPDRVPIPLAEDRIAVDLTLDPGQPDGRRASIMPHGSFVQRLGSARAVTDLLAEAGFLGARREHVQGDASTRAYERLFLDRPDGPHTAILMIAPRRPDGPPIRFGKPYSALAKLAESVHAFVAIDRGLTERGLSAPKILAADLDRGYLILEDLGSEGVVGPDGPIEPRYQVALDVLLHLHAQRLPGELPLAGTRPHRIPRYDLEALLIETELLLEWYLPHRGQNALSASQRLAFVDRWTRVLEAVVLGPITWTLRDFHSPNLLWLVDRNGVGRIGLLDFQDCVLGHPAYDVASLLQDARVDVPEELELRLLGHYARGRVARDPGFSMARFAECYAILGAQRATKILGIFARLNKRDGKPQYLAHLPRIETYLQRSLAHPVLAPLRAWYDTNLPALSSDTRAD